MTTSDKARVDNFRQLLRIGEMDSRTILRLAAEADCSEPTVRRWLEGKSVHQSTLRRLADACEALGVEIAAKPKKSTAKTRVTLARTEPRTP